MAARSGGWRRISERSAANGCVMVIGVGGSWKPLNLAPIAPIGAPAKLNLFPLSGSCLYAELTPPFEFAHRRSKAKSSVGLI